jgi:hypothetical protein
MIHLDSEALPRVQPAEPLFQLLPDTIRVRTHDCCG